jgi:putative ABC transport system permease protein
VVDKGLADQVGLAVGDTVSVETDRGIAPATVVGVVRFGTSDSALGTHFVLFDLASAEWFFAEPGRVDGIGVVAADGVSQADVRDRVATALRGGDVEVITGDAYRLESQDDLADSFAFFRQVLLLFAVLAVVVGAFVIYTSFSFIVAQRQRQVALIRAVGAGRGQVLGSILLESVAVGVAAAAVGYLVGLVLAAGLARLMLPDGTDLTLTPSSGLLAVGLGVGVTVVAALVPAWHATRTPPVAVLRDVAADPHRHDALRLVAGLVLAAGGAVAVGVVLGGGGDLVLGGAGIVTVCVGLVVLGPLAIGSAVTVLGAPFPRLWGVVGRLAQQNIVRSARRSASTASALMVCMGAVTIVLVVITSLRASIDENIDRRFVGDFVVESGEGYGGPGIPATIAEQMNALDDVEAAAGVSFGLAEIAGEGQGIVGVDSAEGAQLYDLGVVAGDLDDLARGGIAVFEQVAEDNGWEVGDEVPVRFARTGRRALPIVALTSTDELLGPYVVDSATFAANFDTSGYAQILVRLADGVGAARGRAELEPIVARYPWTELQDLDELKATFKGQFDPLLVGVAALLVLTVVVAVIGVVNTLVLSIVERTREIGLLRAVGTSRRQIRSTIHLEAVLIALFGVIAALALGVVCGRIIVQALEDQGFTAFAVPYRSLAGVTVATATLSLLAAVLPARWASRRPILAAVTTE